MIKYLYLAILFVFSFRTYAELIISEIKNKDSKKIEILLSTQETSEIRVIDQ